MDPESFDWNSVDSIFVKDDTYENINAPKWIDLSVPDDPVDDEAWFCNPDCQHPKTAQEFCKSTRNSKLLRSLTNSGIFPFRDRNRKYYQTPKIQNHQSMNTNGLKPPHQFNEDSENQNPNITIPCCNTESSKLEKATMKSSSRKKKLLNELPENSLQNERKPKLKNTFSARNLFAGRELLNQIMEFCSELKNLRKKIPVSAKKGMPEENGGRVSGDLEERVGDRERVPLVGVEEGEL